MSTRAGPAVGLGGQERVEPGEAGRAVGAEPLRFPPGADRLEQPTEARALRHAAGQQIGAAEREGGRLEPGKLGEEGGERLGREAALGRGEAQEVAGERKAQPVDETLAGRPAGRGVGEFERGEGQEPVALGIGEPQPGGQRQEAHAVEPAAQKGGEAQEPIGLGGDREEPGEPLEVERDRNEASPNPGRLDQPQRFEGAGCG